MKYTIKHFISLCLLVILAVPMAYAQQVNDLYTGRIAVSSQSDKQREQKLPDALAQVLVKVSGNPKVAAQTKVKPQLKRAAKMMQQYGYKESQNEKQPYVLEVKFNPQEVNNLLQDSKQAIWGPQRPLTIMWLVLDGDEGKQILGVDADTELTQQALDAAEARGIPMMLPLLDLQDMGAVSVDDVWAPFPWTVQDASKRYGSQAQLIGRISKSPTQDDGKHSWNSQWLLVADNTKTSWQSNANSIAKLLNSGINEMADVMAERYAVLNTSDKVSELSLAIYGVDGLEGYSMINAYLKELSLVNGLEVHSIGTDYVVFDVSILGGEQALAQAFASDHLLVPSNYSNVDAGKDINLSYRLVT